MWEAEGMESPQPGASERRAQHGFYLIALVEKRIEVLLAAREAHFGSLAGVMVHPCGADRGVKVVGVGLLRPGRALERWARCGN